MSQLRPLFSVPGPVLDRIIRPREKLQLFGQHMHGYLTRHINLIFWPQSMPAGVVTAKLPPLFLAAPFLFDLLSIDGHTRINLNLRQSEMFKDGDSREPDGEAPTAVFGCAVSV